ncbi:ATP-binding cassette domain-containing protein [Vagococcus xieshaowenii]|nr:ABC transporter ATP-binding protein [Vagococcus xieshaowenii]
MLITKYGKKREWLLCLLCMMLDACQGLIFAYIVSGFTKAATNKDLVLFKQILFVGAILLIGFAIINYSTKLTKVKLIQTINESLKTRVMAVLLNNRQIETSEGLSFLTNDLKQLETNGFLVEIQAFSCLFKVVISIAGALLFDVKMTIVYIVGALLPLIVGKFTKGSISRASKSWQAANQCYVSTIKDTLSGLTTIRTYHVSPFMQKRMNKVTHDLEKSFAQMTKKVALSDIFVYFISWFSGLLLPFALGVYLTIKGQLEFAVFMGVLQLSNNFVYPLIELMQLKNQKATTTSIQETLNQFLDKEEPIEQDSANEIYAINESMVFESLIISDGEVKQDNLLLMPQTSLEVRAGEKILITAPSGFGKSTLLKTLQGQKQLSSGSYQINQLQSQSYPDTKLQSFFSYIQQTPYLFEGTLRFNVTLGEDYSDEALEHVIEQVGLADVVAEKGWDYLLGEGQGDLSGGQIQRLEIARALLRKRPVLLIDEGTSALDKQTSLTIRDIINAYPGTVIEVGHKLSTEEQRGFDRVIPLDKQAREAS